ncbi:Hsp20/alpha crystallin family protein [Reichenbachiella carrageenanivorans]|uniref:Hsp20/alpha crystallin family protein n=1 Tax=Reichenbachiella carrageenanivorans TaxID=2979869 RepID=A0ABY6D2E4_9BACT|nr:Hsp20/alpha crystallin family protein [Reichenbachiella carrageenanivorans]UXX80316.1 Hsp20/alpha crystallin family protein [Reichenbachiella carrageenanivorans]
MSLIKYNPRTLRTFTTNNLFDDLFNDRFFNNDATVGKSFTPQVDISETDKAFELSFAIPGIKKEEIKIDLNEGQLIVSGERKFEEKKDEKNFHTVETRYGSFSRSFHLPDNIDAGKVEAQYENGLLNISIPKDEKKIQKKTIAIK